MPQHVKRSLYVKLKAVHKRLNQPVSQTKQSRIDPEATAINARFAQQKSTQLLKHRQARGLLIVESKTSSIQQFKSVLKSEQAVSCPHFLHNRPEQKLLLSKSHTHDCRLLINGIGSLQEQKRPSLLALHCPALS